MATDSVPGEHSKARSFVRRDGRLTLAQRRALDTAGHRYIISPEACTDLVSVFANPAPTVVEIGSGDGENLVALARRWPGLNFLGNEVYTPGLGRVVQSCEALQLSNIRLVNVDAVELVGNFLPAGSLQRVLVFFPDPWPKRRHHKRRLVRADFLDAVARCLSRSGSVQVATDWAHYAAWIDAEIDRSLRLERSTAPARLAPRPAWRPVTRFERRARREGRPVFEFHLRRRSEGAD